MGEDERLRRRREQYRARRIRETPEQRQHRLDRHNEYERRRYAALSICQPHPHLHCPYHNIWNYYKLCHT